MDPDQASLTINSEQVDGWLVSTKSSQWIYYTRPGLLIWTDLQTNPFYTLIQFKKKHLLNNFFFLTMQYYITRVYYIYSY